MLVTNPPGAGLFLEAGITVSNPAPMSKNK